jgi:hypothetical protein
VVADCNQYGRTDEPRSGCPINASIEVGDRWSLLVLRDIVFGGGHGSGATVRFITRERVLSGRFGSSWREGMFGEQVADRQRDGPQPLAWLEQPQPHGGGFGQPKGAPN